MSDANKELLAAAIREKLGQYSTGAPVGLTGLPTYQSEEDPATKAKLAKLEWLNKEIPAYEAALLQRNDRLAGVPEKPELFIIVANHTSAKVGEELFDIVLTVTADRKAQWVSMALDRQIPVVAMNGDDAAANLQKFNEVLTPQGYSNFRALPFRGFLEARRDWVQEKLAELTKMRDELLA